MSRTTDQLAAQVPQPRPPRVPSRRPRGFGVLVASAAAFLIAFAVFSWRMAAGEDPALGLSEAPADAATVGARRPVIMRRIVKLRVVHDPAPVAVSSPDDGTAVAGAPVPASVTAPAPAPAPAPVAAAPAPATPVTSSS